MNHQQGFVVGVSGSWRPVEASSDYCFVVDHGEFVVQLVTSGQSRCSNGLQWFDQWLIALLKFAKAV